MEPRRAAFEKARDAPGVGGRRHGVPGAEQGPLHSAAPTPALGLEGGPDAPELPGFTGAWRHWKPSRNSRKLELQAARG